MIDWSNFKPAAGTLLLSEPTLADPNFARTVVYLTAHDDEGSVGFVLNRPLEIGMADLGEGFKGMNFPLFEGGPVELDTLHYVHRLGPGIPGVTELADEVFWGGDFEIIKKGLPDCRKEDIRFFLGYSGWAPGQLEAEMEEHAWLVAPALSEDIFLTDPDKLWEKCIRGMGGEIAKLAGYPMDPRWN